MSKNTITQKTESTGAFAKLKEELATSQQQQALFQAVAQDAAVKLIKIEDLLNLQVGRKPKFWNILFHFGEVIAALQEVIKIIKEFKAKYMTPQPTPDTTEVNDTTK